MKRLFITLLTTLSIQFSIQAEANDFFGQWKIETAQCQTTEEFGGMLQPCDLPAAKSVNILKLENEQNYPDTIKSGIRISIVSEQENKIEYLLHTHVDNHLDWSLNEGKLNFNDYGFTYDFIGRTETWGYLGTTTTIERVRFNGSTLIIQSTMYALDNNLKHDELNFTQFFGQIIVQTQQIYLLKR